MQKQHNKEKGERTMKKTMFRTALITITASLFLINGNLFASETDDRIESSAQQSYVFKTYLKGDDIKIKSTDGSVVLTGTVSEYSHKLLAQETITSLPGVKSVDNKLTLKEDPAMYSDAWLITKVKSTLWFHRNVNATGTEVLAKDGIITLRGTVSSEAQKDLTTEYAKDVDGVKSVNNEMTVFPPKTSVSTTMGEKMDAAIESIDDASITALVKTTLLYHRSTSGLKTTVETKDGVVTLKGITKNAAEKDLATKFAADVHGVKSVVNNMTVE
jgi:osmotically-inducible protein OsmY